MYFENLSKHGLSNYDYTKAFDAQSELKDKGYIKGIDNFNGQKCEFILKGRTVH